MHHSLRLSLRRAGLALSLIGLLPGASQAGLVTGAWDPGFGAYLPGLSWQVQASFYVPDACASQADGDYASTGLCAGVIVNSAMLRLFDTGLADPNNFLQINAHSSHIDFHNDPVSPGYGVNNLRITAGQVVGFDAGRRDPPYLGLNVYLTPVYGGYSAVSAVNNLFGMIFRLTGPEIECFQCVNVHGYPSGNPSVYADKTQLSQFLVTYNDNGSAKQTNSHGDALGARLDGAGNFIGLGASPGTVPEPGALGLALAALAALAACAALRRKR